MVWYGMVWCVLLLCSLVPATGTWYSMVCVVVRLCSIVPATGTDEDLYGRMVWDYTL